MASAPYIVLTRACPKLDVLPLTRSDSSVGISVPQGQPRQHAGAPWAFGKLLQQQQQQHQQASQQQRPQPQKQAQPDVLQQQSPLIQELDQGQGSSQTAAATGAERLPDTRADDNHQLGSGDAYPQDYALSGDQFGIRVLCDRVQALEAASSRLEVSSSRLEAKIDKILQFCTAMTAGV